MKRTSKTVSLCVVFCAIFAVGIFSMPYTSRAFEIIISVAPNTLNLQSMGQVVTVHTDIAYSSVDAETVFLNSIAIDSWKADNRGNFVAKFLMSEVKALATDGYLAVPGENELTLTGSTKDGAEFTGSTSITVIDIQPSGRL